MNTTQILETIDGEISRLTEVRALLAGTGNGTRRHAAKVLVRLAPKQAAAVSGRSSRAKRHLSRDARERIAAAQRKRWAKVKREKKAQAQAASE